MAFLIDATMKGYKVLGVNTGTSKKGNTFKSISVFKDGRTAEVSVTDASLFMSVDNLNELDVVNLDVRAVAGNVRDGRANSYITLLEAPVLVQAASDGLGY